MGSVVLADLDAFFDPVREAGKLLGLDLGHFKEAVN